MLKVNNKDTRTALKHAEVRFSCFIPVLQIVFFELKTQRKYLLDKRH